MLEPTADQAVLDVARDGGREEDGLLRNESDLVAEVADVPLLDRNAINLDDASDGVVESLDHADDRRFAGTGAADQGSRLAFGEDTIEVVQDLDAGAVEGGI